LVTACAACGGKPLSNHGDAADVALDRPLQTDAGDDGEALDVNGAPCVPRACYQGFTAACGNCEDDDGDGLVDMQDPQCLSPCDGTEEAFSVPPPPPDGLEGCRGDCLFDANSAQGDDHCDGRADCDPLAPACAYRGATTCDPLLAQPQQCRDVCLPFVPNGCDCFGCCELTPKSGKYVWLNSRAPTGEPSCLSLADAADPARCHPCTPNPTCINRCEDCEVCIGRDRVDPSCASGRSCPAGQACGGSSGFDCPAGAYCLTGCCVVAAGH
jgi:hypothetical protein